MATLADIRALAQQRADMENSDFVTDAEWLTYINSSYSELYDILIQHFGADYFVADPFEIDTVQNQERYPLPFDFYKLLGVDLKWSGAPSGYVTLRQFNFAERNRLSFAPGGRVLMLHYVPRLTPLVVDEDALDVIDGWEELVVVDAARKALVKEESDTSALEREKAGIIARIESAAENRDAGSPSIVVDTSRLYDDDIDPIGATRSRLAGPEMRYRLNGNNLWVRGGQGWP